MIVVAVKEAAFLIPVQGYLSGVNVQHDLAGSRSVCLDDNIHRQFVDALFPERDFLVAVRRARPQLQPVERTFAR